MEENIKKAIKSLGLFVFALALSLNLTSNAFAYIIVDGDGSVGNPYKISTCAQLHSWINDAPGTTLTYVNFLITNNLDCTGFTFNNTTTLIHGSIDGGNHKIQNINIGESGFIYILDSSTIKNLYLESGNNDDAPYFYAGSFASQMINSELNNVKSSLTLKCDGFCGGLVAIAQDSTITNSVYDGEITTAGSYSGGLVGSSISNKTENLIISKSAFLGKMSSYSYAGGLIGSHAINVNIVDSYVNATLFFGPYSGAMIGAFNDGITINKSYTDGTGSLDTYSSGMIGGYNSNIVATHSYVAFNSASYGTNVGHVMGYGNSNVIFSDVQYLDESGTGRCEAANPASISGCSRMTTSEMDLAPTSMGFDLTNTWQQDIGKQPTLRLTDFNAPPIIPNSSNTNNNTAKDTVISKKYLPDGWSYTSAGVVSVVNTSSQSNTQNDNPIGNQSKNQQTEVKDTSTDNTLYITVLSIVAVITLGILINKFRIKK